MGQQTYGVLYGAKVEVMNDDDGASIEEFCEALSDIGAAFVYVEPEDPAAAKAIRQWLSRPVGPPPQRVKGEPYWLAGFWLAVGAGGEDGVPFLETGQVCDLPSTYSEPYTAAVAAWPRVAAAVASVTGAEPGRPSFWIAETEVA